MARRRYSPEEIERGLTALILAGSSPRASLETGIKEVTLRAWKQQHRGQYERLTKDLEPRIVDIIAAEAEGLALAIADRERAIIESFTNDEITALEPKDKAATLRNLSTSKALQLDKVSSPLRERPSHVQAQHTGLDALVAQIERAMGIPSTAIEVPNQATTTPLLTESIEVNARVHLDSSAGLPS